MLRILERSHSLSESMVGVVTPYTQLSCFDVEPKPYVAPTTIVWLPYDPLPWFFVELFIYCILKRHSLSFTRRFKVTSLHLRKARQESSGSQASCDQGNNRLPPTHSASEHPRFSLRLVQIPCCRRFLRPYT